MPGSIHVSVLDFSELPSSSPSSSILTKVSMGKSDYQTWGKGDFSLPLTTLRDNVVITLHDTEGKELSHAGFQIKSIAKNGYLDESLSLEGGGIVHLKLQFVLNEEARNKIQRMRESAAKRKRDELLTSSPRLSKITSSARATVTPSFCVNHEVSDSQATVAQIEVLSSGDQAIQRREENEADMEIIPKEANGSDISKGTQSNDINHYIDDENIVPIEENSSRVVDKNEREMDQIDVSNTSVVKDDSSNEKFESSIENEGALVELQEMPRISDPKVTVISKEDLSFSTTNLAIPEMNNVEEPLEETPIKNKTDESEDASSIFSAPRGVHVGEENIDETNQNMINNEENQNKLEEKNEMKLDPINFPKISVNSENSKKDLAAFELKKHVAVQIEKREPLQRTSSNVRNMISALESSLFKEMRPIIKPPPTKTQPEKVVLEEDNKELDAKDGTEPTNLFLNEIDMQLVNKKSELNDTDEMKNEECIDTALSQDASHLEEPSVLQTQDKETEAITENDGDLEKILTAEEINRDHFLNLLVPEEGGYDSADIGMPKSDISLSNSHEINIGENLENEMRTVNPCECDFFSAEASNASVFADEEIKQMKDSEESYKTEERLSQRISFSENVEKDISKSAIYSDVNESGEIKSSNERSHEAATSSGPFGRAIKIALMIAFGSLVLFTRQRKPR